MQQVHSFKVASTLAAQRIVAGVSGSAGVVGYPEDARRLFVGVTIDDVDDTNQAIPVQVNGIAKVYFNDTCAAWGLVSSDASGRGIPFTPANTSSSLTLATGVIGLLVDSAVSATGTVAQVLVNPQLMR